MEGTVFKNDELAHYGVLGQKWGIRRFQNKDGTLTNAGKKRYEKELEKVKADKKVLTNRKRTVAKIEKLNAMKKEVEDQKKELSGKSTTKQSSKAKNNSSTKRKSVKDMSNEEIQAVLDRIDLEKKYAEAMSSGNKKETSRGQKFVMDVLETAGKDIATQATKFVMGTATNKVMEALFDDPKAVNPKKGQKDK